MAGMTKKEAAKQAESLFGAYLHKWPTGDAPYRVMVPVVDNEHYQMSVTLGRGDSWDAALADAASAKQVKP